MKCPHNGTYSISVVVIGLDEALHLDRCLESVQCGLWGASEYVSASEIIYVDSGSTDRSVDIALRRADAVFRLNGAASAAAARAVGLQESSGEWVLFLDGDMELDDSWLRIALEAWFQGELGECAAGVVGTRDDVTYRVEDGKIVIMASQENVYRTRAKGSAFHFGGALLARRNVLCAVGGYRPGLRMFEEPDLHARLRAAGWYVVELPLPFIRHYCPEPSSAWRRLGRSFEPSGPSLYFGYMARCAVVEAYLRGFVSVCRAPVTVWVADGLSVLGAALGGGWLFVAGVQAAAAMITLFWRRPEDYVLARGRLVGMVATLAKDTGDWPRLYPDRRPVNPAHSRVDR